MKTAIENIHGATSIDDATLKKIMFDFYIFWFASNSLFVTADSLGHSA